MFCHVADSQTGYKSTHIMSKIIESKDYKKRPFGLSTSLSSSVFVRGIGEGDLDRDGNNHAKGGADKLRFLTPDLVCLL